MKSMLKILSYSGLALTGIPSILLFTGSIEHETHLRLMGAGMILWFATAVFWIKPTSLEDGE